MNNIDDTPGESFDDPGCSQDAPRDPQEDSWRGSSGDLASAVVAEGLPQLARLENSEITAGVGLMNGIGEYNCFLNVIIQCLWHLTNFRHAMLGGDPQVALPLRLIRLLCHTILGHSTARFLLRFMKQTT